MEWASIISGLVKLANLITSWLHDEQLTQTGKALEKGDQDAKTLDAVKKSNDARNADNAALNDELRID